MSGQATDWLGMAIASYEWMAAITLVVVAFVFLPKLLRCGIYTIPEFLEYRYGVFARTVMAAATLVILVGVPTASVIYSGAKVVSVFFGYSVLGLDLGDITIGANTPTRSGFIGVPIPKHGILPTRPSCSITKIPAWTASGCRASFPSATGWRSFTMLPSRAAPHTWAAISAWLGCHCR
jgi:hypothetical protein